jgi:WD40 repeat protein
VTPPATPPDPALFQPAPSAPPPQAKPIIPDYELLRMIGRGSYGDVWLARGVTGLYRAVKLVWRERFIDLQPYEREFKGLREFAAISLSESRQLALLHVGRNDAAGFFYYVMELADDLDTGRDIDPDRYVPHTLKAVQERKGRLLAPEVVGIGVELARGLGGLHARGLVHRDVKPSNVIFVGGAPKLADIGLVTVATSAQTFVGTEGFVPPEGPGTPAADVFSLGKVLYEAVTGLDRHDYPRLPADFGALPDRKELLELNEILIRACDPASAQRYTDAAALLDDLLLLQAGRSMRRLRAAERRLTRAVRIGTVLALIAGVAGTGAFLERRRAESENALRRQAEAERDDLARKTIYSAGLARAQRALELGDLGQARQQLQEIVPKSGELDLRGFEWHALWSEAQGDPADVLRESGPPAEKVRFSPDGKLLAVHTSDKRVTLWDAATKKIVRTIEGVHRFAGFSSDGRWLVGTDPAFALQRWTVTDGTPDVQPALGTNRPLGAVGPDRAVCFTDAEKGGAHALRVWDFSKHAEVARIEIAADADGTHWDFYRATISEDGSLCALVLLAGRMHEARRRLLVMAFEGHRILHDETFTHRPFAIAFSPDKQRLAVALGDTAEVQMLDLARHTWDWRRKFGTAPANVLTFSSDGDRLIIAGRDQVVRVVKSASGENAFELRGQDGNIDDVTLSPSGATIAAVSNNGEVRLWAVVNAHERRLAEGFWAPSAASAGVVRVSHDGRKLALPRNGQSVEVLAVDTLSTIAVLPGALNPVAFIEADNCLLALTNRGKVQRWRLDGPQPSPTTELQLFDDRQATMAAVISPDHHWLVATNATGAVQFWDFSTRQLKAQREAHDAMAWSVSFDPRGETVVTSGLPRTRIWQSNTGELRAEVPATVSSNDSAFSPGRERWLAVSRSNGDIEIRTFPGLVLQRTLHASSGRVQALTFSPDGARLVCAGPRGMLHIFTTDDWRELTTLSVDANTLHSRELVAGSLAFSGDGKVFAAYFADGRVRVWRR